MKDYKVNDTVLQAELLPAELPVVTGGSWLCSHNLIGAVNSHSSTLCTGLSLPQITVVIGHLAH